GAFRRSVKDRFDVVAVWIQDEGGVVTGMVGPLSRCAVVPSPRGRGGPVEGLHHLAVPCLERQVMAAGGHPGGGRAVGARDHELVGPEEARTLAPDGDLEGSEDGRVEGPARIQVLHDDLQVVDEAAAVQRVHFHGVSRAGSDIERGDSKATEVSPSTTDAADARQSTRSNFATNRQRGSRRSATEVLPRSVRSNPPPSAPRAPAPTR